MIENLRLDSTAEHNSDGTLAQGYGTSATYGNFSGLANAESEYFSDSITANSIYYSGTQSGDVTINIGASNYPGYRMPRYNNWNNQSTSVNRPQNPTSNSATNTTTSAGMYSYDNCYTWHAAIADLTDNGANNQSTTNTSLSQLVGTYQKAVIWLFRDELRGRRSNVVSRTDVFFRKNPPDWYFLRPKRYY